MSTTQRASMWSVTINNPTPEDEESINLARQRGWKVSGQLERGEHGTIHYQLAVQTPQIRFSAVKKAFPRAHIEVAKSPLALLNYVAKEETRAGDLPEKQDKYPSLSKFWDLVFAYLNDIGKEGLDAIALEEGHVKFYRVERHTQYVKHPLCMLDEASRHLIKNGYHIEGIAGNPSIRSQWNLFHDELLLRSYLSKTDVANEIQQDAFSSSE